MDVATLGAAIAIAKGLPDTAVGRCEAAAQRAETAAQEAETHNMGVSISGHTIIFEEVSGGNG